jgi:hypothetical protein
MKITEILRDYKRKKSIVDTTMTRIKAYESAIDNPQLISEWSWSESSREAGMPGAPLRNTSSPVEKQLCKKELTLDIIREWIKEDESRIFWIKQEVEQIEKALEGLTAQQKLVIESKYFERMNWREIEIKINDKFRQQNKITESGLRKVNTDALQQIEDTLHPFYKK